MDIKTKIRVECAERGISIRKLEREMGLGRNCISDKMSRGTVSYQLAQKIANHLGKSIEWAVN